MTSPSPPHYFTHFSLYCLFWYCKQLRVPAMEAKLSIILPFLATMLLLLPVENQVSQQNSDFKLFITLFYGLFGRRNMRRAEGEWKNIFLKLERLLSISFLSAFFFLSQTLLFGIRKWIEFLHFYNFKVRKLSSFKFFATWEVMLSFVLLILVWVASLRNDDQMFISMSRIQWVSLSLA